jgi:hypothetical protein
LPGAHHLTSCERVGALWGTPGNRAEDWMISGGTRPATGAPDQYVS